MEIDAIIGLAILAAALGLQAYLVFWGRRTIERIARSGRRSAREIGRELRGGR